MLCCLWERDQRGNNAAHLLGSTALSKEPWCETGSFSHHGNHCSPQSVLSLSFAFSQRHLLQVLIHLVVLVDFFSLIFWLSEFQAVWFSGTSGCLLILDWLLSSFWLCKEAKGFYLHVHLGWNFVAAFNLAPLPPWLILLDLLFLLLMWCYTLQKFWFILWMLNIIEITF